MAKPSHPEYSAKPDLFYTSGRDSHPPLRILSDPQPFAGSLAHRGLGRFTKTALKWIFAALSVMIAAVIIFDVGKRTGTDAELYTLAVSGAPADTLSPSTPSLTVDVAPDQDHTANQSVRTDEHTLPAPVAATIIEPENTVPVANPVSRGNVETDSQLATILSPATAQTNTAQRKTDSVRKKPKPASPQTDRVFIAKATDASAETGNQTELLELDEQFEFVPEPASASASAPVPAPQNSAGADEDKDVELLKAILNHDQDVGVDYGVKNTTQTIENTNQP